MVTILPGDCVEVLKMLPDASVNCGVTSPPYWGLRDYGVDGQIGLEKTPEEYVAKIVAVFREVRRVLRNDGTLWLNMGDSYNGSGKAGKNPEYQARHTEFGKPSCHKERFGMPTNVPSLKPKDLCGIPWRVAFALQADGWYLRQDIIWHKPNPMPESVADRCTKAHEYIFLLAKSSKYFYDAEAIKEPAAESSIERNKYGWDGKMIFDDNGNKTFRSLPDPAEKTRDRLCPRKRNRRSVWTITTQSFRDAHFATFPEKLVEPCILAGTSERGCCPACGSPWERVIDEVVGTSTEYPETRLAHEARGETGAPSGTTTIGWKQTCKHTAVPPVSCTVLDPFCGSGTVGAVAERLGRNSILIELNPKYVEMAKRRTAQAWLFCGVRET